MEWRCKWCEKPHEENDPPCDNCGHSEFEKAVVPMSPESTDDSTPKVWTCTECGREHQKNSPPCSRCGNTMLEQREADYSDVEELSSTGWSDVLDRKYTAGFAVVGVLGLVLSLGLVGVVDLPGLGGPPSPPDAPGEGETVNGVSLAAAEEEFVASVNEERTAAGAEALQRGETVAAMATYYNKRRVESEYDGAEAPAVSELDPFDPNCDGTASLVVGGWPSGGFLLNDSGRFTWDAEKLGSELAASDYPNSDASLSERVTERTTARRIGADIHVAPDDGIYVTAVYC